MASEFNDSAGEAAGEPIKWLSDSPYRPPAAPDLAADPQPPVFRAELVDEAKPISLPQPQPSLAILAAFGFVVLQLVLGIPIAILAIAIWGPNFLQAPEAQWMMIVAGTGASFLGAIAIVPLVYGRAGWRRIGLRLPSLTDTLLVLLLVVPLATAVSELSNLLAHVVPPIGMEFMEQLGDMPLVLLVVGACLFPAVGEEIFFRGFIGRGLVGHWGPVAGVLVTSLLFGAVHLVPLQAISAFVLGIALHYLYLTTKSLVAPILLHFFNNLLATLAMRYSTELPVPGLSVVEEDQIFSTPLGMLLVSIVLVAAIVTMLYATRTTWWASLAGKPYDFGYVTGEIPPEGNVAHSRRLNPLWLLLAVGGWGLLVWLIRASVASAAM